MIKQLQAGFDIGVNKFDVSGDGLIIACGDEQGELKLFTYDDCKLVHMEKAHTSSISAVCFAPDNALIITADENGQILFWRV